MCGDVCETGLSNPLDMMFHIQPWMILSLLPLSTAFEGNFVRVLFHHNLCISVHMLSYSIPNRGAEYCDEHVCVCLSAIISSELRMQSSPMAVA